jgi:hypothetical protein
MKEIESTPSEMDRVISCVYSFPNGTVSVFDQRGRQMPEYEGRADEQMDRIIAHAPPTAFFGSS